MIKYPDAPPIPTAEEILAYVRQETGLPEVTLVEASPCFHKRISLVKELKLLAAAVVFKSPDGSYKACLVPLTWSGHGWGGDPGSYDDPNGGVPKCPDSSEDWFNCLAGAA